MAKLYNLARVSTATAGTGTITLGAAVSGYLTFALAGVSNLDVVDYGIKDGANSETGTGTYTAAGTTLTRTVTKSTNANAAISLSGSAEVYVTARAETLNDASVITTGTMATARLGSGTASSASFLRGDQTWQGIPLDFRNTLAANGDLEVWQRGAGGAASIAQAASLTAYGPDRWFLITNATQASVISQQAGLVTNSRWSARILRNSGQTGTGVMRFEYPLTTDECITLRGQSITVQFYASSGANWSPTSGTVNFNAYFGTGAEGKRGAVAFTGETNPLTSSVNVTAGAAAAQTTFTGGSTVATDVTQGCFQFSWTPVGTAGAADNLNLDRVQLEIGSFATAFERLPFRVMLHECQRHYCKSFNYATAPAQNAGLTGALYGHGTGTINQATGLAIQWRYPVTMRVAPTITTYNPSAANAQVRQLVSGDGTATTATAGTEGVGITATANAAADGSATAVHAQADAGL